MVSSEADTSRTVIAVSYFGNMTFDNTLYTNFTSAGIIRSNVSDGPYNISYTYEPAEYVNHSSARAILALIPIFFALALMLIGVLLIKKMGWF